MGCTLINDEINFLFYFIINLMAGSPLIEFIDPEEEIIPYVGLPKLFPMA